jgi:ATP-dependent helicase HrpA
LADIAERYHHIRKQLKNANELAWVLAIADINQQLALLFAPGFIADTPWQQLEHYPRYLTAITQRLEKLRGHLPRDKQLSAGLKSLSEPLYVQWRDNQDAKSRSALLLEFRWLLEEYRVSLFAQALGTSQPVSEKRLRELWKRVNESLLDRRS